MRHTLVRSALACSLLLALGLPALSQGTAEQRAACTPDVLGLCSADIPDVGRIKACLARERARVSPACRQAMGGDVATTGSLGKRQERHPTR